MTENNLKELKNNNKHETSMFKLISSKGMINSEQHVTVKKK